MPTVRKKKEKLFCNSNTTMLVYQQKVAVVLRAIKV